MDNVNDLARQFLRGKMHALEFKRAMIKELQGSVGSCELLLPLALAITTKQEIKRDLGSRVA
jgi:hypothetical protein